MDSILDIEALLAPISSDEPCGANPRADTSFDSAYHQLKDAREQAMSMERPDKSAQPGDADSSASFDVSKWQTVVDRAVSILSESAKDLEVCALLIEGLARTGGPAGIRDGFSLTAQLITTYWDELYPRLDPDDEDSLEDRIAAFTGLNGIGQQGTLPTYIAKISVTDGGAMGDFHSYDYDRAWLVNSNQDPEARESQAEALGFTIAEIEDAAAQTSATFYIELDGAIKECQVALSQLDEAFNNACGHDAPPSSMIAEALEKILSVVAYLGKDHLAQAMESDMEDQSAQGSAAGSSEKTQGTAKGAINSREDAIARLRGVAKYFREAEPHSPISYSLQTIIRWSQMPLDKLIEEWIQDHDARERYMLMTGVRASGGQDDDNSYDGED